VSTQFTPLSGTLQDATEKQTALANSVMHLFKSSFNPTPSNILADYTAAECDFDGYSTKTITAFFAPILAPTSGYMIQSPQVQWAWAHATDDVGNTVGGMYLVDSTGKLRETLIFTNAVPMTGPGNGLPLSIILFFPTGF
jgi:hypothetical protein